MTLFIKPLGPEAATLATTIQEDIKAIIAEVKAALAGDNSVDLAEAWHIFAKATAAIIHVVEEVGKYDGATKKSVVLDALGQLYDDAFAGLEIKGIPNFIGQIFGNALRPLFLQLASGLIDFIVGLFSKLGWGKVPVPAEPPGTAGGPPTTPPLPPPLPEPDPQPPPGYVDY